MPDIILSPIPYESGNVDWSYDRTALIRLTSTRFIYAFQQTNPYYVFFGIADISGLKTGSANVNYIQQRAYLDTWQQVRIWKISDNRFVQWDNSNDYFKIYDVSTDDFVEVASGDPSIPPYDHDYSNGYTIIPKNDNEFYEVYVTGGSTSKVYQVNKVTFADNDTSLNITGLGSYSSPNTIASPRVGWQYDPSGNIFIKCYYSSWTGVESIMVLDPVSDTITIPTNDPGYSRTVVSQIIPHSPTSIIGFQADRTRWHYYDGSTWTTINDPYAAHNGSTPYDGLAFDSTYSMQKTSQHEHANWYARVHKLVSSSVWSTSQATTNNLGLLLPDLSGEELYVYNNRFLDLYDPETVIELYYESGQRWAIRTIFPG